MNVVQMRLMFERLVQTADKKLEVKEKLTSYTILKFLNQSQQRCLREKYLGLPTFLANVEYIQRNSGDLRNLIMTDVELETVAIGTGPLADYGVRVVVPTAAGSIYLFYIRSDIKLLRAGSYPIEIASATWVPCQVANHKDVNNFITNPWNKPIIRYPLVVLEDSDELIIIGDDYTTLGLGKKYFSLTYLRQPKELHLTTNDNTYTTTCELGLHMHEEVVNLAYRMFIEEYRYKLEIKEPVRA